MRLSWKQRESSTFSLSSRLALQLKLDLFLLKKILPLVRWRFEGLLGRRDGWRRREIEGAWIEENDMTRERERERAEMKRRGWERVEEGGWMDGWMDRVSLVLIHFRHWDIRRERDIWYFPPGCFLSLHFTMSSKGLKSRYQKLNPFFFSPFLWGWQTGWIDREWITVPHVTAGNHVRGNRKWVFDYLSIRSSLNLVLVFECGRNQDLEHFISEWDASMLGPDVLDTYMHT